MSTAARQWTRTPAVSVAAPSSWPLASTEPGTRPTGGDGKVDESQSRGESSRSCAAGAGDGIALGATGWVTVNLAPGRYELVCDEPWHYANGMFDVVTVV